MSKALVRALMALGLLCVAEHRPLLGQTLRTRDASGREIIRRCQPATSKKNLPPLASVIDSVAVVQQIAGLPPGGSDRWLLSLGFPNNTGKPAVRWVEPEIGPDTVIQVVSASTRLREGGEAWAVRLQVERGSHPTIALEPALYCPPQPSPVGLRSPVVQRVEIGPGDRVPTEGQRIRMVAEVVVLETGTVADVRLIRGSGMREVDDEFLQQLRRTAFLPALLEGMPIPGRYRTDGSSPRP